jgi:hypothetical protein
LVNLREHEAHAPTDARDAAWFGVHDVPSPAFDHDGILQTALERKYRRLARTGLNAERWEPSA